MAGVPQTETRIRKPQHTHELETCARMMADSDPWLTLQRGYELVFRMLTNPAREVYVAAAPNDEIAGVIVLCMQGAFIGYIQSICVAPNWRNKGIGSQLVAFAEQHIFSETANVFLCVSSFNQAAQKLYERLGYIVVGELKDYILAGYSEILMRKSIAPLATFKKAA